MATKLDLFIYVSIILGRLHTRVIGPRNISNGYNIFQYPKYLIQFYFFERQINFLIWASILEGKIVYT